MGRDRCCCDGSSRVINVVRSGSSLGEAGEEEG